MNKDKREKLYESLDERKFYFIEKDDLFFYFIARDFALEEKNDKNLVVVKVDKKNIFNRQHLNNIIKQDYDFNFIVDTVKKNSRQLINFEENKEKRMSKEKLGLYRSLFMTSFTFIFEDGFEEDFLTSEIEKMIFEPVIIFNQTI